MTPWIGPGAAAAPYRAQVATSSARERAAVAGIGRRARAGTACDGHHGAARPPREADPRQARRSRRGARRSAACRPDTTCAAGGRRPRPPDPPPGSRRAFRRADRLRAGAPAHHTCSDVASRGPCAMSTTSWAPRARSAGWQPAGRRRLVEGQPRNDAGGIPGTTAGEMVATMPTARFPRRSRTLGRTSGQVPRAARVAAQVGGDDRQAVPTSAPSPAGSTAPAPATDHDDRRPSAS